MATLLADGSNNHLDGRNIVHALVGAATGDDVFVVHTSKSW
jgi:hypothetical protein